MVIIFGYVLDRNAPFSGITRCKEKMEREIFHLYINLFTTGIHMSFIVHFIRYLFMTGMPPSMRLWSFLCCAFCVTIEGRGVFSILKQIEDSPLLWDSLLQTVDRARHTTASSGDNRRRTVSDIDCDYRTDHIDSIEASCHQLRYEQLRAVEPEFQKLLAQNNTGNDKLVFLSKEIEGDQESTELASGVLQNLLLQRIAIYGGTDPGTNSTDIGELARFKKLLSALARIHTTTVASLDNLWNALVKTDHHVAYETENKIFAYGTAVNRFLGLLSNSSQDALDRDVSLMGKTAFKMTQSMLNMVKKICATQTELVGLNSNASDISNDVAPVIQAAAEETLQSFSDSIERFADDQSKLGDVIESMNNDAKNIMSRGSDSVQNIVKTQVAAFAQASELMLATFKKDSGETANSSLDSLVRNLNLQSSSLDDAIAGSQDRLSHVKESFADDLSALKRKMENQTATLEAETSQSLNMQEINLTDSRNKVSSAVSETAQKAKSVDQQYSGASTSFSSQSNDFRSNLASALTIAGTQSVQLLASSSNNVGRTSQQIGQLGTNGAGSLSDALSGVNMGLSTSDVSTGTTVGDQATAVSQSQQLGEAQMQASLDSTHQFMDSSLTPVQNTVLNTASGALALANSVNADRSNTVKDATLAQESGSAAIKVYQQAAKMAGMLSVSQSTYTMSGQMGSANNLLSQTEADLSNATHAFESQQDAAQSVIGQSEAWAHNTQSDIAEAGDSLGMVAERTASSFQQQMKNVLSDASEGVDTASSQALRNVEASQVILTEPMFALIRALNDTGPTPNLQAPELKQLQQLLYEIQGDYIQESDQEKALMDQFEQSLSAVSQQQQGELPGFATSAEKKLISAVNTLSDRAKKEVEKYSKRLQTVAGQLDANYDPSIPALADGQLSSLDVNMNATLASLTNASLWMSQEANLVTAGTPGMEARVKSVFSSGEARIASSELDLLKYINLTAQESARNLSVSPDRLSLVMVQANSAFQSAVDDASNNEIQADAMRSEEQVQTNQINFSSSENNVVASLKVLQNQTSSTIADLQSYSDSEFTQKADTLASTQATIAEAAGLARAILAQANRFQMGSNHSFNQEASEAYLMVAKLNTAVSAGNTSLENELAQATSQEGFSQQSAGIQATGLISGTNQTITDVQSAVNMAEAAVSSVNSAAKDAVSKSNSAFASFKTQLTNAIDGSLAAVSLSHDEVKDQIAADSGVSKLELQQARDFIKYVRTAWLSYSDYEKSKFEDMADKDALVLRNMEGTARNGLSNGRLKIAFLNSTLENVTKSLEEDSRSYTNFLKDSSTGLLNTSSASDSLGSEIAGNETLIESMIGQVRKNMTIQDAAERDFVVSNVSAFDASIASMSSQILASLS